MKFILVVLFSLFSFNVFAADPNGSVFCEVILSGKKITKEISVRDTTLSADIDSTGERLEISFVWDGTYNIRILKKDSTEAFGTIVDNEIYSMRFPERDLKISTHIRPAKPVLPLTLTPPQTPGPFYPGYAKFKNTTNDLSNGMQAHGETIVIEGKLLDQNGNPIAGAELHLWQTDGLAGKYRHPADPGAHLVDPKFNSWGKIITGADGSYRFRTVRPIAYPADVDWMRPDHLHFKVYVANKEVLVTQTYFANDHWLFQDTLIYQALSAKEKQAVTVELKPQDVTWSAAEGPLTVATGTLNLVIR